METRSMYFVLSDAIKRPPMKGGVLLEEVTVELAT